MVLNQEQFSHSDLANIRNRAHFSLFHFQFLIKYIKQLGTEKNKSNFMAKCFPVNVLAELLLFEFYDSGPLHFF